MLRVKYIINLIMYLHLTFHTNNHYRHSQELVSYFGVHPNSSFHLRHIVHRKNKTRNKLYQEWKEDQERVGVQHIFI